MQNLLFSCLQSKNVKIKVYRTIILPFVLYGCETALLTLREEHKPVVLENRLLRRIFGPKREKVTGKWRRLHNEELNDLYSDDKMKERCGACSTYWWRGGEHIEFWWEDLRKRDHLEDPGIDGRIILKWILSSGMGV